MAAHFDISVESLREWKRLYFDSKSGKFVGKKLDAKDQEIKALRKQVSELTQEWPIPNNFYSNLRRFLFYFLKLA